MESIALTIDGHSNYLEAFFTFMDILLELCLLIAFLVFYYDFQFSANVKKVKKVNGRRQYNKLLACYYCEKTFRHRIKRHLECKHYNERMVAEALAKTSKVEIKKAINRIKNLGNYKYNINVINKGSGSLIVSRRPNKVDLKASDYLPCVYCFGFCYKKELWRHARTCPWNKNQTKNQAGIIARSRLLLAGSLEPKESSEAHMPQELSNTVFTKMRQDDVYRSLVNDQLILQYGKVLINQLGPRRTHHVSQRMRQLARLKMQLNKTHNQDEGLHFYVNPSKFDAVVTAVKQLAGYSRNNAQISVFETPSLAITLGHNIGKAAEILRGIAIRNKDDVLKRDAEDFLQLQSSEWNHLVSSVALATLRTNKFNKPTALPVTSDLVLLKNHLDSEISSLTAQMEKCPNPSIWGKLAEVVLVRVILFNKRRGSEVAKLLASTYKNRPKWKETINEEIFSSLKPVEKELLKRLQLVENQGKKNKRCPILLTQTMVATIDILEKSRNVCEISSENQFIFASPTSKTEHIDSWHAMNKLAKAAGCVYPNLISSSRLRKYLATVSQILHMEDYELEWLSRHLAHDINTHKNHYRQHDAAIEIAKIGSLVLAADQGKLGKFAGKKLSDINVSG